MDEILIILGTDISGKPLGVAEEVGSRLRLKPSSRRLLSPELERCRGSGVSPEIETEELHIVRLHLDAVAEEVGSRLRLKHARQELLDACMVLAEEVGSRLRLKLSACE